MKNLLAVLLAFYPAAVDAQDLRLPFDGDGFVLQAGDTPNVNHHASVPAQMYGVDFVKVGGTSGRELTRGKPTQLEDFFSWGETVLAPAAGVVVTVVDGLPDNPLGSKDPQRPAGNHIVIQTKQDRFVFLGHLQNGTVSVKPGDRVQRAQSLGKCGNSGNSDFPHIHLHVQDTATLNSGTGQNPIFGPINVELTGKAFRSVTWPLIRGLFVSNAGSGNAEQK